MNSNSTSGCSVTLAAPCLSVLFLICEMKVVVSSTPGLSNLNKALFVKHLTQCLGEGNGTPLSILAWKIPWMEEPGGLQSMGSHRVRHD